MPRSRKLLIHIGSHKTGSTSIQATLYRNRNSLKDQGFVLFNRGPDGKERVSGNALTWIKFRPSLNNRVEGRFHRGLVKALDAAGNNVIISAETFSWVFSQKAVTALAEQLRLYFDDITIVAYLRRQDHQAVSQYQQSSKPGAIVASRFYGSGCNALPPYQLHFDSYLDYFQRIGLWAAAFGEDRLKVRLFDPSQLHRGDVVEDFFHTIGLSLDVKADKLNESTGFERTKIGHLMSDLEYPEHLWKRVSAHLDNSGKMLPSRLEAEQFYAHFRDSNERLRMKYLPQLPAPLFSEDFSNYPEHPQDQWVEASANRAITHLLAALEQVAIINGRDMELLAQCADVLSQSDAKLSTSLTELASRVRGSSKSPPGIVNKLRRKLRRHLRHSLT
jgi:hypothetical protein